jgi:hypothetical protein
MSLDGIERRFEPIINQSVCQTAVCPIMKLDNPERAFGFREWSTMGPEKVFVVIRTICQGDLWVVRR